MQSYILLDGLCLVFTEREERIRIISARPASKSERNRYYETIR
ncbi:MAG: BrnT family toxin [Rhodothermaceae bacterium]|nr:BrnT family toxin [Rhodothermaceae bacterium]